MIFEHEQLWNKSRALVRRGLEARNAGDQGTFCLWSVLALELLGKAALADVHPALVVDPTHTESLLAVCGVGSPDAANKSIKAKAIFARLQRLAPKQFGQKEADFCNRMVRRRNAELHSGDVSLATLPELRWIDQYWRTCALILNMQDKSIADWVGSEEAGQIRARLGERAVALEHIITARIFEHRTRFDEKYPEGSAERAIATKEAAASARRSVLEATSDDGWEIATCPACDSDAVVAGAAFEISEREIEYDFDEDGEIIGAVEHVTVEYSTEIFSCAACELELEGFEEVEAAGGSILEGFNHVVTREPEYEEEYNNE